MNQSVKSMTGFTRYQFDHDLGLFIWEIRSLNHRFRDLNVQLPYFLKEIDTIIRQKTSKRIKRGKLDISLRFFPNETVKTKVIINKSLVNGIKSGISELNDNFNDLGNLSVDTLLNWPGLIEYKTESLDEIKVALNEAFDKALDSLILEREKEGKDTANNISEAIGLFSEELAKLEVLASDFMQKRPNAIREQIEELKIKVDANRLEQEIVILLQRTDVNEELSRLGSHIANLKKILGKGQAIGRHLDFILQELNREANTIASKAQDVNISNCVVNMKVIIEQIREQVQNIE